VRMALVSFGEPDGSPGAQARQGRPARTLRLTRFAGPRYNRRAAETAHPHTPVPDAGCGTATRMHNREMARRAVPHGSRRLLVLAGRPGPRLRRQAGSDAKVRLAVANGRARPRSAAAGPAARFPGETAEGTERPRVRRAGRGGSAARVCRVDAPPCPDT